MMVRSATDTAALHLRMATMQIAGIRVPPRVRTIPPLRRRLPVEFVFGTTEEVQVRPTAPRMDTLVTESVSIQSQRA